MIPRDKFGPSTVLSRAHRDHSSPNVDGSDSQSCGQHIRHNTHRDQSQHEHRNRSMIRPLRITDTIASSTSCTTMNTTRRMQRV
jgi:hypothetical protein